jgi:hypothetical protein
MFDDRVDTKIRVHAHVNESSNGTGSIQVHIDHKGVLYPLHPDGVGFIQ